MNTTITTWNVLAQSYIRPGRYPGSSPAHLAASFRHPLILDRLASLQADLLCLQELEPGLAQDIATRLGSGYTLHRLAQPGRPDTVAVLVRGAAFTVLAEHPLHFTTPTEKPHGALLLRLRSPEGQQLGLACTHLRWQPFRTPRHEHKGRLQLLEIDAAFERWMADVPTRVLAGDLNTESQGPVIQAAEERGWRLSCRSQRPWDTAHINGKRRKLDYLLLQGPLRPAPRSLPALQRSVPLPHASEPSDHLCLTVDYTTP